MKKITRFLIVAVFCLLPLYANADVIGNVTLEENFYSPAGHVSFNSGSSWGNYYLDYETSINGGKYLEAFCVEGTMDGPDPVVTPYTLLSIDTGLTNYETYRDAAWIADNYFLTNKAAAQIAIWELLSDGKSGSLNTGFFRSTSYTTDVVAIFQALNKVTTTDPTNWVLAVNPTVTTESFTTGGKQNYLVRYNVPEPASLLLFGLGLLGLAGARRKMKK